MTVSLIPLMGNQVFVSGEESSSSLARDFKGNKCQ